ncbi:MAG: hypothetical protein AAF268_01930 [Cyanobacteria bacterium P01_A01_bin.3]
MKYDDASWHYGGDFPEESPPEFGATHIALFMKWCFSKGWAGDLHLGDEPEDTQRVINGLMPATEYFLKYCDGKLTDADLNAEGNAFAEAYYGDDGLYYVDYIDHFGELMYVAPEIQHDYALFSTLLENRYRSGQLTKSQLA